MHINASVTIKQFQADNSSNLYQVLADLSEQYARSPFTQWAWFDAWTQSLPFTPLLFAFFVDDKPIGFTFLHISEERRKGFCFKRGWINQTGQQRLDQTWIEYNQLVCKPGYQQTCIEALIGHLTRHRLCDELYVSMTADVTFWQNAAGHAAIDGFATPAYALDMSACGTIEQLLELFSANTRRQLKKAYRLVEQALGHVRVERANTDNWATFFAELAHWHKEKWHNSPEGSGFANDVFIRHHQHLLSAHPSKTLLIRVLAGTEILGYAYYLLKFPRVYFYCSGVNHSLANGAWKPGLLMHVEAMQLFAQQGYNIYDFLAGEAQYKRSLSNTPYHLMSISCYLNTWRGRLLRWAQKWRRGRTPTHI